MNSGGIKEQYPTRLPAWIENETHKQIYIDEISNNQVKTELSKTGFLQFIRLQIRVSNTITNWKKNKEYKILKALKNRSKAHNRSRHLPPKKCF